MTLPFDLQEFANFLITTSPDGVTPQHLSKMLDVKLIEEEGLISATDFEVHQGNQTVVFLNSQKPAVNKNWLSMIALAYCADTSKSRIDVITARELLSMPAYQHYRRFAFEVFMPTHLMSGFTDNFASRLEAAKKFHLPLQVVSSRISELNH